MGYKNCSGCGSGGCGEYNVNAHGDIGAHYKFLFREDLPSYTRMAYSPSRNEIFSDFNYNKVEIGYDNNLKDIRKGFEGKPIEAYLPMPNVVADFGSACPSVIIRNPEIMPKRNIIEEILRAQAEVIGRLKERQSVMIRTTEVEQELHLKRRFRKIEIIGSAEQVPDKRDAL